MPKRFWRTLTIKESTHWQLVVSRVALQRPDDFCRLLSQRRARSG